MFMQLYSLCYIVVLYIAYIALTTFQFQGGYSSFNLGVTDLSRSQWHLHFLFIAVNIFFIIIYAFSQLGSHVHNFRLQFWEESVCLLVEVCEIEVSRADVFEG